MPGGWKYLKNSRFLSSIDPVYDTGTQMLCQRVFVRFEIVRAILMRWMALIQTRSNSDPEGNWAGRGSHTVCHSWHRV